MDAETLEQEIEEYMFTVYAKRAVARNLPEPVRPDYWNPDWADYMYAGAGRQFELPGLPEPLTAMGEYNPAGDWYADFSGPRYMLFGYGDQVFAKEGRNVSHVGTEFQYGRFFEVKQEVRTVTVWTGVDGKDLG